MNAEHAFLTEIGNAYLARSRAPDEAVLRSYRPAGLLWPVLRAAQGRATGLVRRSADIDGQRYVWLEGGNPAGSPVVLLHGFGASKENWVPLLPFLSRQHRLFVLDLPGWGESHFRYGLSYSIDAQVTRLAHWLERHVPGGAHLVGSSMGGAISSFTAARHPELVASLTLMNAAGVRGSQASEFETGLLEGNNVLVADSLAGLFRLFTTATERNRHLLATLLVPVMAGAMLPRSEVNTHMFRELVGNPPSTALAGASDIRAPTLVLWGDKDRVIDVSCADTWQQLIPHASVRRLKGVGHLPMVEAPSATARCLHRFWRAHAAPGKGHGVVAA